MLSPEPMETSAQWYRDSMSFFRPGIDHSQQHHATGQGSQHRPGPSHHQSQPHSQYEYEERFRRIEGVQQTHQSSWDELNPFLPAIYGLPAWKQTIETRLSSFDEHYRTQASTFNNSLI